MCPWLELNPGSFGTQANAVSTVPNLLRLSFVFLARIFSEVAGALGSWRKLTLGVMWSVWEIHQPGYVDHWIGWRIFECVQNFGRIPSMLTCVLALWLWVGREGNWGAIRRGDWHKHPASCRGRTGLRTGMTEWPLEPAHVLGQFPAQPIEGMWIRL